MNSDLAQDFHDELAAIQGEHAKPRVFSLREKAICHDIHSITPHPTTDGSGGAAHSF